MNYVPGIGSLGSKLLILGDCPSVNETLPFTGASGRELDKLFLESSIKRNEVWLTNVCKYHVPDSPKGKKIPFAIRAKNASIDIHKEIQDLQNEITSIKPNCILALGGTALWALSGKTKIGSFRGSILHGMGVKFVPTYRPSDLLNYSSGAEFKGYWNRQIMIFDFKRALYQSKFPELALPSRVLEICKNSAHLAEFYSRYSNFNKVSVDIEANGTCIPICIGLAFNKQHGMTIPLWNEGGISSIPTSDMIQIWILLSQILMNHDVIGQNFNYDRDKIVRLGFTIKRLIDDVMMKAQAINPELPKGLAFNQSIYTEEPFYKDEGMYEGSIKDLLTGCARDACVTFEINENMDKDLDEIGQRQFYENFLMQLPEMYLDIQNQGFGIDKEERDRLVHKYIEWDERVRYELFKLVGTEVNVNSPKQISLLLFENFKLPNKPTTGEDDITELLNSPTVKNETHRRVMELILEGRKVKKAISTYLMALPDFDGRMKTTYFPCLDTGRTSTSPQDTPIRPTIEIIDENGKKKNKVIGMAFQTMTKHGDVGADIRGMYIP